MAESKPGSDKHVPSPVERRRPRLAMAGFLRRLLAMPAFHVNGRPRGWVRKILFHRNGRPRNRTRFLVQDKCGRPRKLFRQWFEQRAQKQLEAAGGRKIQGAPRLWYFMGDMLDWLSSHAHVADVCRVTMQIFANGLDGARAPLWYPAVGGGHGIVAWYDRPTPAVSGTEAYARLRDLLDSVSAPHAQPSAGDHVLFSGGVWNSHHVKLFERLSASGIGFSVLVTDIIPILDPSLAEPHHLAEFAEWLGVVARDAATIFVPCEAVRDDIAGWCVSAGVERKASIVVVPFGPSIDPTRTARAALRPEVSRPFVLTVGTMNVRKNQAFLCRVWRRLLNDIGPDLLPMLVLAGHDDLDLARSEDVAALRAAGRVIILSDVNDDEVDRLYRECLFVAFPSKTEGHGLPVADSLAYGKLPVASNLASIRDQAGDLPFYFDPLDEEDAYRALRRAIEQPDEREAAERRIAVRKPTSWVEAANTLYRELAPRLFVPEESEKLVLSQVVLDIPREELFDRARPWCEVEKPRVSILVLNWNAAMVTRMGIEHIQAHTSGITYEVLVADNGSARADLAVLSDLGPGVTLLPLGVNRFFGEANNIMAERARGDLLCLLNNDVFVSPGWLARLVDELDQHPEAGAVGPVFLFLDRTVQEAGIRLDPTGIPERQLRGQPASALADVTAGNVDYISAAALVMSRDTFIEAGGFDLSYEPAYYEDADLGMKLAALGKTVRLCPDVSVIHLEGYSTDESAIPTAHKHALGDLNRSKFLARWGAYLANRSANELAKVRAGFPALPAKPQISFVTRPRTLIYSPYDLTPGGGERYLLTLAAALAEHHDVTIATPKPYSTLRLRSLGALFGIDLTTCRLTTMAETAEAPAFDRMVVMGNYLLPPVPARAARNFYLCQFPFMPSCDGLIEAQKLDGYEAILVYSDFAEAEVSRQIKRFGLPEVPIKVISPPVPQFEGPRNHKKQMILSVGRFFIGGHSKRQDLLIAAFRKLHSRMGGSVELHLAGASTPAPEHMEYLRLLQQEAKDLPVIFHVNCSSADLDALYREASVYWHGTGLGTNLAEHPERAEHFGIAIVEAMSAGCVSFALNAGGAREIVRNGVDGFLYDNEEELIARTQAVFASTTEHRSDMRERAQARARDYAPERFMAKVRELMS